MSSHTSENTVKALGAFRIATGYRDGGLSNAPCVLLDEPVEVGDAFFDAAYFVGFDSSRYETGEALEVVAKVVSRDNSAAVKADATYGVYDRSPTVDVLVVKAAARVIPSL